MNILDNDLYKFKMLAAAAFNAMSRKEVKYKLFLRGKYCFSDIFLQKFTEKLEDIKKYNEAVKNISKEDSEFISKNIGMKRKVFVQDLLSDAKEPNFNYGIDENGEFYLEYSGMWKETILLEVPLLSAISELYYRVHNPVQLYGYKDNVANHWNSCFYNVIEMGTRRRISLDHQEEAIKALMSLNKIDGTSNLHLARKYQLKAYGSVAHEWYLANGNSEGCKKWLKTGFNLNTYLPDTFTSNQFFDDVDQNTIKEFDFVRQDSGNPFKFVDLLKEKKIKTKNIIFSDSLNPGKINLIAKYCESKFNQICFGVGSEISALTNERFNAVIKMVEFGGYKVRKISDDPQKSC